MMELSTRTLGDWLEHWALTTPDKEYIVYSDRNLRFTWKQFNDSPTIIVSWTELWREPFYVPSPTN